MNVRADVFGGKLECLFDRMSVTLWRWVLDDTSVKVSKYVGKEECPKGEFCYSNPRSCLPLLNFYIYVYTFLH